LAISKNKNNTNMSTLTEPRSATLLQRPEFKNRYDNYIDGKFTPPVKGQYFDVVSPVDGKNLPR
jgi:aldehyde dehydrogenase